MDENRQDEAAHQATLDRWRRKKEMSEDVFESAQRHISDFTKEALKNPETRKNLQREFLKYYKGEITPGKFTDGSGFFDDGEIITGDDKPWSRD